MSLKQTGDLVEDFLHWPKRQIHIIHETEKRPFPSTTLCSLQPLSSGWSKMVEKNGTTAIDEYFDTIQSYVDTATGAHNKSIWNSMASIKGYYQNTDREIAKSLGPDQDTLINNCHFIVVQGSEHKQVPCGRIDMYEHPEYLNCYTISMNSLEEQMNATSVTILIFLDDFTYPDYPTITIQDQMAQMHGVKVRLHGFNAYPRLDFEDILVPAGMAAEVELRTTYLNFLSEPHGDCISDININLTNLFNDMYVYSMGACDDMCRQLSIMRICKCKDPTLPAPLGYDMTKYPYCGRLEKNKDKVLRRLQCLNKMLSLKQETITDDNHCSCPQPCFATKYIPNLTMAVWPHESFHLAVYENYIKNKSYAHHFDIYESIKSKMKSNRGEAYKELRKYDLIKRNFVKLTVKRHDFRVTKITEVPLISGTHLLSSVGGALSFWLGITVVTLVELLELFWDCLKIGVLKKIRQLCCPKKAGQPVSTDQENDVNNQYRRAPYENTFSTKL
ncbi:FMRFamide-activated amiloride-sensitive sodium channel-like [Lineus longissimus]|uniref:FMRFamide-activated amiloride-sensitive sodium channel-like n=1 Tax=Lineus longissimus TaxID=88925 RepID=UPI00315D4A43